MLLLAVLDVWVLLFGVCLVCIDPFCCFVSVILILVVVCLLLVDLDLLFCCWVCLFGLFCLGCSLLFVYCVGAIEFRCCYLVVSGLVRARVVDFVFV